MVKFTAKLTMKQIYLLLANWRWALSIDYEHKLYLDSIDVDARSVTFERFEPTGEEINAARL